MSKYIDTDLLKKEIKRLKDEYTDIAIDSQRGWVNANFVIDDLEQLLSQIDSLQKEQPEVDLEEEMDRFFEEMPVQEHENIFEDTFQMIARHFYELGLNTRKEENK